MYNQRYTALVLIMFVSTLLTVIPLPVRSAQFIIADWSGMDEYGQGISSVYVHENRTGSWVAVKDPAYYLHSDSTVVDVNGSQYLRLQPVPTINHSLFGLADYDAAKAIMRMDVVVTNAGETIFSQQNLTLEGGEGVQTATTWWIAYEIILPFMIIEGSIYTVVFTYEIYQEVITEEYLHDCSSLSGITFLSAGGLSAGEYGIGSNGSVIEFWIMPNAGTPEGVQYELDFTDFNNTSNMNITIRYRVEGATNRFYYTVLYDDSTSDTSSNGKSTSWTNLNLTADNNKILDKIRLANYDDPAGTASGNLSVWLDYIEIYSFVDDWAEVETMDFVFNVVFHMWGYNTALIILGLVMIPASTIYLAHGAKHDRSSTRLYYGLILFMLGCGLFIGGVLP